MQDVNAHYSQLTSSRDAARLRTLREIMPGDGATITVNGRPLVDLSSNDYLGLSKHPLLKQRSIEFINRFGTGSGASRLLSGNLAPFEYIERKIAAFKGTQAALLLPTGFQANATVLTALATPDCEIFLDKLCHASLLSGALMSQSKWRRFTHNEYEQLNEKLSSTKDRHRIIVTESVFSMDGDRADLDRLQKIATANGALLYVDEAHATGVLGTGGAGLTAMREGVHVAMGTFGKALGSFGAYVACTREIRDYLVNFCGGLIYSTALPPSVLGAIDAALDVIPTMEKQRQLLQSNAEHVRERLRHYGFNVGRSESQIIPIITGSDRSAVQLAQYLEDGGFFAPAIRPPTVPEGEARVRLSLTTTHSAEQLQRLCELMRNWREH